MNARPGHEPRPFCWLTALRLTPGPQCLLVGSIVYRPPILGIVQPSLPFDIYGNGC